jgi:hypothetical protein
VRLKAAQWVHDEPLELKGTLGTFLQCALPHTEEGDFVSHFGRFVNGQ